MLRFLQVVLFVASCGTLLYSQRESVGVEVERRLTTHEMMISAQGDRVEKLEQIGIEKRLATIEARLDGLDWLLKANLTGTLGVGSGMLANWIGRGRKRRKDEEEEG